MKKKKVFIILCIILSICLSIVGCTKDSSKINESNSSKSTTDYSNNNTGNTTGENTNNTNNDEKTGLLSMTTSNLDESRSERVVINSGEKCEINVKIASTSGSIDLEIESIVGTEDETYYEKENIVNDEFTINIDREGTYVIKVDCDNHTGSFNVEWKVTG